MLKLKRGLSTVLLVLLLAAAMLPTTAFAAGKIDPDQPITLTVRYQKDSVSVRDAYFNVYKVADVDEARYSRMTLTEKFAPYADSVSGLNTLADQDQEGWMFLASTLNGLIKRDRLASDFSGKTDAEGNLEFRDLRAGLYLVIGSDTMIGEYVYSVSPFMVYLPGLDYENNVWVYDNEAIVGPKASKHVIPVIDDTVTRKALKVWEDDGDTAARPPEISVSLLCDGNIYETVTLNEGNNWRFEWPRLPANHEWLVTETAVTGYTMRVEQNGVTFVITNTKTTPPESPTPTPTPPTTPPPDEEDIDEPPIPLGDLEFEEEEDGDEELVYLPQTGVLWWPVPVLFSLGIIFLTLGVVYRRREEQ